MNLQYKNFCRENEQEITQDILEIETLIGWSTTCLDQTISYYLDCNADELNCDELTSI